MDLIMSLRDKTIAAGLTNTYGARHAEAFADSVKESGWLDEAMLTVNTVGYFNIPKLLAFVPVGVRALLHGKLPAPGPLHHRSKGVTEIHRIFSRLEGKKP